MESHVIGHKAVVCSVRHFIAAHESAIAQKPVDFGSVCIQCEFLDQCRADWIETAAPLFEAAGIFPKLCRSSRDEGGNSTELPKVQIISDGTITCVEANGVDIPVSAVYFQHVAGSSPRVILEFPVDGITVQTTNTVIIKKADSHTGWTV